MDEKLRQYIDELFAEAPMTKKTVEVKEEILQNLKEKYYDLLAEGKSEEAAYNIAVASIGDFSQLIRELKEDHTMNNEYQEQYQSEYHQNRKRSALITSVAVSMYILCIVPPILFNGTSGAVAMFVMVAAATGLLIYNNMTKNPYPRYDDTLAGDFSEWREVNSSRRQVYKSVSSALWALTAVLYVLISFWTHAWHLTWLIFLIAGAVDNIIKAGFDLTR